MNTRLEERLTDLPEVPNAFGEDGGHFYRYYDALADEIDDDMVTSLKAQLDGILIYAGLFAGVNSAFLALTLPEMSADPADDTNVLLFHLVTGGGRNITSMDDLPSGSFSPASGIFSINILFSLSLTLALLAAFLAVLGQQWLVYYRKRGGGGADAQRWEQLRRYLGAKRWRLEAILDDILPSLLQLGLVIFCIAFALYLKTLSPWVCYAVAIPMGLALACILFMAVSAAVDWWCPFKSPLSRALQLIPSSAARPAWHTTLSCLSFTLTGAEKAKMIIGRAAGPITQRAGQAAAHLKRWASRIQSWTKALADTATNFVFRQAFPNTQRSPRHSPRSTTSEPKYTSNFVSRIAVKIPRPAEPEERLNAIAVKRILCTSEDPNALIYTGVNLCALESQEHSEWLLSNEEVYYRLWEAVERYDNEYSPTTSTLHTLPSRALHSAFIHLVFSSGKADFLLGPRHDFQPFPPTPTDNTNFDKAINDLRSRVRVIGRPLHNHSVIKHLSATELGLLLIDFILSPRWTDIEGFDRWFRVHAILSEALARKSNSFVPFRTSLLAWAVKAQVELNPRSSWMISDKLRREALSQTKEYAAWSLGIACNIVLMYRQSGAYQPSEIVKEALATCHLDRSNRPSNRVYVSLLQHGWNYGKRSSMDNWEWKKLSVATMIDLCSAFIRHAQQLAHLGQEYLNQLRDDLVHCLEFLDEIVDEDLSYAISYHKIDEIPRKYAELLELASKALQQRLDIVGNAPWRIVIRLGNILGFSGELLRMRDEAITEECQKAYRGIESALGDEGFLKLLNNLESSDNPADPPSIQVVQAEVGTSDPGGDTATPEYNAAISSQEESAQAA